VNSCEIFFVISAKISYLLSTIKLNERRTKMQAKQLQKLVIDLLEDMKAKEIVALDVSSLTDVMDAMIVCSGTSNRHTRSLAQHVITESKAKGVQPLGVEGEEFGEWVLVDLGDVVVHIMLEETRQFYSLEKLWSATKQEKEGKKAETKAEKKGKGRAKPSED